MTDINLFDFVNDWQAHRVRFQAFVPALFYASMFTFLLWFFGWKIREGVK